MGNLPHFTGNLQINWQRWEAFLALPPEQWEGLE